MTQRYDDVLNGSRDETIATLKSNLAEFKRPVLHFKSRADRNYFTSRIIGDLYVGEAFYDTGKYTLKAQLLGDTNLILELREKS